MPLKNCTINKEQAKKHISNFAFTELFIALGWDHNRQEYKVQVQDDVFNLTPIAQKRGFAVYLCPSNTAGRIPEYTIRRKIESGLTKVAQEHLVIFVDAAKSAQVWQWVKRSGGKVACRENKFYKNQQGEVLLQKLQPLAFSLEDEDELDITHVLEAVTSGFDTERITRKFYDLFQKHHDKFLKFIEGIPEKNLEPWYISVLLNRLMFIYFIQKKGFLDGNQNYLSDKLKEAEKAGKNKFYPDFLCPLFFEGLAKKESDRSAAFGKLLGKVPYLNGGIFAKNQLEESHGHKIKVPDTAFKDLFAFFDQYQWHLDDRPVTTDNEINPDVLGYIFEKYINQKQMGAYYTKEDITGYISRNTIIPFIFDSAQKACKAAFDPAGPVWGLVKSAPDRYFYESVRKGTHLTLPQDIADGINDVSKRSSWNKPASEIYALPTEIWRETVARRQRYEEIKNKIQNGEVTSINDFITYNLNIELFTQDIIENCPSPELLRAFWKAIETVSVLDPTCGSGAFLFAALNILEPLYETCLVKMQDFINSSESPSKFPDFKLTLENIHKHPSEKYFVYKSIILKNLYGVDIMEEAVEICKLRLFLKLVAQVDDFDRIEPLPDIDFNIRAGNTLVGFATFEEAQAIISSGLDFEGAAEKLNKKAEDIERLFTRFRKQQTEYGGNVTAEDKKELRQWLKEIDDELNNYLAGQYKIDITKKNKIDAWLKSHKPFHWFVEFYGIMKNGGFDVIIGNPPYVELSVLEDYKARGYICEDAGNLYALVIERCRSLGKAMGRQGYIVPVSSVSTDRYSSLQKILLQRNLYFSSYDDRPSRLFDGLEHIRLTIHIIGEKTSSPRHFSTRYNKWASNERQILFQKLLFSESHPVFLEGTLPKIYSPIEHAIINKLSIQQRSLNYFYTRTSTHRIFYSRKVGYFLQVLNFEPRVLDGKGQLRPPSEFKELTFTTSEYAKLALCCLNSNLFYWFVTVFSDCRHVNKREVDVFPVNLESLVAGNGKKDLLKLGDLLMQDLKKNSINKTMSFKHDTLTVQCIYPKYSKPIINEIDCVLAKHYGFTAEELDFIVNYDLKYRIGQEPDEE